MIDNGFQFNWSGMSREPAMAAPQGGANLSNTLGAIQAAQMQGYRPLPSMQGYQPTLSGRQVNPDSSPATQPEIAMAHEMRRRAEIEEQIARNEQKIQELKEEYVRLQQENKDSVGEMERKIAANRAGIGDSSQYNAWRAREDSRAAMENARQEDNKGKLSVLRTKVNNAMRELSYARGDKQEAAARQIYDDALAEYNKAAQAAGEPQMAPNTSVSGKTVTMFDTKDFIRQHRDSKGHWDSEENKQTAYDMAHSLGDEGVQLLDEIFGQKTQGKAASDAKKYADAVKEAVKHLHGAKSGSHPITVNGKKKTAEIVPEDGKKVIYVDGKKVDEWEL